MQKFVLTTIMGVEKIAKKEIEKQGGKIEEVTDRLITFSGDTSTMVKVNLWSRVGNKVYMLLAEQEGVDDFDKLYDMVNAISWKKFFKKDFPIAVRTSSTRSELESAPTIQKISKKAIIDSITNKSGERVAEDEYLQKMGILVLIIDNKVKILLDTSGNALHMRGYRSETGDAPIKESLAAALVLLSNWRFKENLYDPFCGSGTVPIEALMIAKNIAPGLERKFAFNSLGLIKAEDFERELSIARGKQFLGDYKIFASDIDPEMVEIAKENAARAGFKKDEIIFQCQDFIDFVAEEGKSGTIVSNPPYGERLEIDNIGTVYRNIDKLFRVCPELSGGVITSFEEFDGFINLKNYKKRKLNNGGEKCYFYNRIK